MEIKHSFIRFGRDVPSVLYEPVAAGEKSRLAVLVMHSDADYLSFAMGPELAKKGYRVLCANTADRLNSLQRKALDLKLAVEYLRGRPDIDTVVLMGHSGGGTLMSAYQNAAENGVSALRGPEKLVPASDELDGLPPADGLMMLDSNFGNAAMTLFSLDPAIVEEGSSRKIDPALDLFNPGNGFDPEGSSYGDAFIRSFQRAQGERNNRLIKSALERLAELEAGRGRYADDEPFIVPGAAQGFFNNKLYAQDVRLMSRTRNAWPLLKADGSVSVETIESVRKPENKESMTTSYKKGALATTVRTFLDSYAIRTSQAYGYDESTVMGIEWESGFDCPPGNMPGIRVPLLVMGMTGNWEFLASETIYEKSASADKTMAFVEGASHLFTTAKRCERFPGEFGDTQATTFSYVDDWLSRSGRFFK